MIMLASARRAELGAASTSTPERNSSVRIGNVTVAFELPRDWAGSRSVRLAIGCFSLLQSRRSFVRQTWGRGLPDGDALLTFLAGRVEADTVREAAVHGDLMLFHGLREAYADSDGYSSLPLKALAFYHSASHHVAFDFLLKTDDDCYVNLPAVLATTRAIGGAGAEPGRAYAGYVYGGIRPQQSAKSKYRDVRWPPESPYTPYVDGTLELMSRSVAGCVGRRLSRYAIPSPIADAVTGHAVKSLCAVDALGKWPLPPELDGEWPERPEQEPLLLARGCDHSIVVRRKQRLLRFMIS